MGGLSSPSTFSAISGVMMLAVFWVSVFDACPVDASPSVQLDTENLSALVFSAPATPGRPNFLTLRLHESNIELLDDRSGAVLLSQPLATTVAVSINGASGDLDDTLTLDFDGGLIAVSNGIQFDGGLNGFDTLVLRGGSVVEQIYRNTGPTSGAISLDGLIVSFSNLEPVIDSTPAASVSYAPATPDAANIVSVTNGDPGDGHLRITFAGEETIDFANKTSVTINAAATAADLADTITIDFTENATGLTNLIVNTGAGADSIVISGTIGVMLTVNGGTGDDTIRLGSALPSSIAGVLGPVIVNGDANDPGGAFIIMNCQGSKSLPIGDRLEISDEGSVTSNSYTLSDTLFLRSGTGAVTYLGIEQVGLLSGSASDTITVSSVVPSGSLLLTAGGGSDAITVQGTGVDSIAFIDGGDAADTISLASVSASSRTTLIGNGGSDVINLGSAANSLDDLLAPVCVTGDGNDPTPTTTQSVDCFGTTVSRTLPNGDTLNLNDQGKASANTYTLTAATLGRSGIATVGYETVERLVLNTGSGNDTVNVSATAGSATTTIDTNDGADQVTVSTTGASSILNLNTGAGNDNPVVIHHTGLGSVTIVQGGQDNDTLIVDNADPNSGVALFGDSGADNLTIFATAAGSVAQVNGGASVDTFGSGNSSGLQGTECGVGRFAFSAPSFSVGESGATATIGVTRSLGSTGAASVNFATSSGTASAGQDYTATSGTLNFADEETSKTFAVPITSDAVVEGNETLNVTLTNPTPIGWASIPSPNSATLTIVDDEPCSTRPDVGVAVNPIGGGRLRVTVTANNTGSLPNNTLAELRFGTARPSINELIDINGQTDRSGTFTVPVSGSQATFDVRRQNSSLATTVHFIARDNCGDVQKLVGGGAGSF
jgi:hypothetical protein